MAKRIIDINNREEFVEALAALLTSDVCHTKHKSGCLAPSCRECINRFFSVHSHLLPEIDATPVAHGKNETEMNPVDEFICSECGFSSRDMSGYDIEEDCYYEFNPRFCPNCGAKMDKDEQECGKNT